jgi:hypothetical protein
MINCSFETIISFKVNTQGLCPNCVIAHIYIPYHYVFSRVTAVTNPMHVAKNIFTSGGTNLRDDKDFNKCLRLRLLSRQSLSVDELCYLIQLKN